MVPEAPRGPSKISSPTYTHGFRAKHTETWQSLGTKQSAALCVQEGWVPRRLFFIFLTLLCSTFLSLISKKAQMILSLAPERETQKALGGRPWCLSALERPCWRGSASHPSRPWNRCSEIPPESSIPSPWPKADPPFLWTIM